MERFPKFRKKKLKPLKLNELLFNNELKTEYTIKTERTNKKSINNLYTIDFKNRVTNNCHKPNNKISNLKYKTPNIKKKIFDINQFTTDKRNNITLFNNYRTNSYLKEKSNKIYKKMKSLLFEEKIKKLYTKKYKHINFEELKLNKIKNKKTNYFYKDNNLNDLNINNKLKKNIDSNYFIEKERIKTRKRFNSILQTNYKKLDECESKFNRVIEKTMKMFSEFPDSLSLLKYD